MGLFGVTCILWGVVFIFSILTANKPEPPAEAVEFPRPRPTKSYTWRGGVFDGKHVWLVQPDSSNLIKINPSDGSVEYPTSLPKKSEISLAVLRPKCDNVLDVLRSR